MASGIGRQLGKKIASFFLPKNRQSFMHDLAGVYTPSLRREKLIEVIREKVEIASNSKTVQKLRVFKEYWKLEMAPPTSAQEMQKMQLDLVIVKEFWASGSWKHLTVKQLFLLILVGIEIGLWFYLGETIGKGHIVGYHV